jgi:hypothetical protein
MKAYQQENVRFVLWADGGLTSFWAEGETLKWLAEVPGEDI